MAELKPIGDGDVGRLAALHAASFDRPWSAAEFSALIKAGAQGWMAEDGFILTRTVAGEAEVLTLAVAPAARRQGLGRRLVDMPIEAAAVFLEVAVDNRPAIALYRAAGFEEAGVRRGYYSRPGGAVDALVMRKSLSPSA